MLNPIESPYNITAPSTKGFHFLRVRARDVADNEIIVRFDFEIRKVERTGDPILPVTLTLLSLIGLSIIGRKRK